MGTVQYTPRAYANGDNVTVKAKTPIDAGHLVVVDATSASGALVAEHAPASAPTVLGVAWADAPAAGDLVAVACTGIVRVVAGATITAGTRVAAGAGGVVVPAGANPAVGYALTSAANGGIAEIQL